VVEKQQIALSFNRVGVFSLVS